MLYTIPGQGAIEIRTIILDLNGTVSVAGQIVSGVKERLRTLKRQGFDIVLLTGDTRGDASGLADEMGIEWRLASTSKQKLLITTDLGPETCVSIGNGFIDLEMTRLVRLAIVTLQAEGVHVQTLLASDVIVPSIIDALDLLIDARRLIATLRV